MVYFEPLKVSEDEFENERSRSINYTPAEINELYQEYLLNKSRVENTTYNTNLFPQLFDAAWSLMLGLNDSIIDLQDIGENLEDFSYKKKHATEIIFNNILTQSYFGPSGYIDFNEVGDRITTIQIYQIRNGQETKVGKYYHKSESIIWENPNEWLTFQGIHPPYDEDLVVYRIQNINSGLVYVMNILAGIGILYSIICAIVVFQFREKKLIKLSSPRINTMIAFGCCLAYIDIILFSIDSSKVNDSSWICSARTWLLVMAFTFAFGSMFAKTWRVHAIFADKKLRKKVVKDLHLVAFVLVFLTFDALLLIVWLIVDQPQWKTTYLKEIRSTVDADLVISTYVNQCVSKYSQYWLGVLYGFKGILLIFGIFFAWETRKVKLEAINDSKEIGISVYNVMVMSVIAVPLVNLLSNEEISILYGITSISIFVCASTTMSLVYGSKIYMIIIHGNKVDEQTVQMPFKSELQSKKTNLSSAVHSTQAHPSGAPSSIQEPTDIKNSKPQV